MLYSQSYGGLFLSSDSAPLVQRKSTVMYVHTHVNKAIVYNCICFMIYNYMPASYTRTIHDVHIYPYHKHTHTQTQTHTQTHTHTHNTYHTYMHTQYTHAYTHMRVRAQYLPGHQPNGYYLCSNLSQPCMNYTNMSNDTSYICIYKQINTHTQTHTDKQTHTDADTQANTQTNTHTRTHMYTHVRTYTHSA